MSNEPLRLVPQSHPALKTICDEVPHGRDLSDLIDGMFELMHRKRGVGLAAPQIGITVRLIVVEYAATKVAIYNPRIVKTLGKVVTSMSEGCLSFPNKRVNIKRPKRVIVEGFNAQWEPVRIDARNLLAFIMQHEIDHLNGVTIA